MMLGRRHKQNSLMSGRQIDNLPTVEQREKQMLDNLGLCVSNPVEFHDPYSDTRELTDELDCEQLYEPGEIVPASADYELVDGNGMPVDSELMTLAEGDVFPEVRGIKQCVYDQPCLYKLYLGIE